MVIPKSDSSSSISSASSVSSLDDSVKSGGASAGAGAVKFLCSYGGRILPRYPDGKLRYVGGDTRVLSVDRSVLFPELLAKMGDLCGWGARVSVRCQLPTEDLDALVTVRSDEDLANLIEEYDMANRDRASPLKIRAFLFPAPLPQVKHSSPPLSVAGSPPKGKSPVFPPPPNSSSAHRRLPGFPARVAAGGLLPCQHQHRHHYPHHHHLHHQAQYHQHHASSACAGHVGGGIPATAASAPSYRPPQQAYLVHSGNYWQ